MGVGIGKKKFLTFLGRHVIGFASHVELWGKERRQMQGEKGKNALGESKARGKRRRESAGAGRLPSLSPYLSLPSSALSLSLHA